jgi:hypothetical protein
VSSTRARLWPAAPLIRLILGSQATGGVPVSASSPFDSSVTPASAVVSSPVHSVWAGWSPKWTVGVLTCAHSG